MKCPVFILTLALAWLASSQVSQAAESRLEGEVERYVKSLRSKGALQTNERTAWLVYDFTSGKTLVSINENQQLQAASMIKPLFGPGVFPPGAGRKAHLWIHEQTAHGVDDPEK